jgi:hypothetical protein
MIRFFYFISIYIMNNAISLSPYSRQEQKLRRLIGYLVSDIKKRVIKVAFPEIHVQKWFGKWRFHKWDVYDHTRKTIGNYHNMDFLPEHVKESLQTQIDWISRETLLLITMAFHDAGKLPQHKLNGRSRWHAEYTLANQLEDISARFHFTEKQSDFVGNLIRYHDVVPDDMWEYEELFKSLGIYAEFLIISYCDLFATLGVECSEEELRVRREVVKISFSEIYQ